MKTVVTAQVGANGILDLKVPLDKTDAHKQVRVTVETLSDTSALPADHDAWLRFIERTAGSITDPTFERHPQGEVEERDSIS